MTKTSAGQALGNLKSLYDHMTANLEWSDVSLMRSILVFLDTQSWQDHSEGTTADDNGLSEIKSTLVSISDIYRAHLKLKVLSAIIF